MNMVVVYKLSVIELIEDSFPVTESERSTTVFATGPHSELDDSTP
jgi:uncharacterized membrane protein